jgi:hypothetical protein
VIGSCGLSLVFFLVLFGKQFVMDSEDYIPLEVEGKQYEVIDEVTDTQFESGGEQYEVIDEVTDTQLESEEVLTEEGVTTRQKTHPEIQQFITEQLKTEQGQFEGSTKQAKDASEEICNVPNNGKTNITEQPPHSELPSEQVVGAEITSEGNRNVSKVEKIPNVLSRSTKKRVDGHQSLVDQTEVENKPVNFVQNMADSQDAPESSGKVGENTVNTEAKQAIGPEKKGESVKSKSVKAVIQPPPLKQPISWDSNILLVGGLLPGQSGVSEANERN